MGAGREPRRGVEGQLVLTYVCNLWLYSDVCMYTHICTCTYVHTHMYMHMYVVCNLVEAPCYGIGRTGQILSNHVAVKNR